MKLRNNSSQLESLLSVPSPTAKVFPMRTYSDASSIGINRHLAAKEDLDDDEKGLGYHHTLMYGRYTKDLGEFAKDEARKLKLLEKRRKQEDRQRNKELLGKRSSRLLKVSSWVWKQTFARLGEDWVFLALLGVIMAFVSYVVDKGINICTNARVWLYRDLTSQPVTQYIAWVSLPVCLILFSAGFVHLVAPQSIGSGIPEMKTILRGVALKEYLTFKTLVAKVVGLTATLGSGMPLGKEGPFVHIASIVAQLLSKLVTSFQGIYENESRNSEMLAAACAVGVGSCFAAPVGGVLFSIEVTTTYFAVRNYWRGFFAAVCGATVFRLLAVWFHNADTVRAIFLTNFTTEFPFDPQELFVFALMGVVSGVGGAAYVWVHRRYVLFMRSNKKMNKFLQKNRFLYPGFLALLVSSCSFPLGPGQFIAGELSTHEQVTQLFSNFTWSRDDLTVEQAAIVTHWVTSYTNVFINLTIYIVFTFFISIIASTIPVPSGIFIPVFKIGAGLGRLMGESMHLWFPNGVRYGGRLSPIIPGGYAVVGAAAFSGAVTHTVSVAVIIFEMTGQITHVVPVMIAVLIANAIAALLQPSMYDSIILIKKLPYLPDLLPSSSAMYSIYVEDFMVRDVKYIWHGISYQKLKEVLKANKTLRSLPLVDSHENMILLGSVQRYELIKMIEKHIGREKRMEVAQKWQKEAEERAREEEKKKQEAELKMRRPSRFEVLPAPDILSLRQIANDEMLPPKQRQESLNNNVTPRKSILKKTNSFNLKAFTPNLPHSPTITPYTTITGSEHRIRSAFEAIFRKSNTLQDVQPDQDTASITAAVSANEVSAVQRAPSISKKVQLSDEEDETNETYAANDYTTTAYYAEGCYAQGLSDTEGIEKNDIEAGLKKYKSCLKHKANMSELKRKHSRKNSTEQNETDANLEKCIETRTEATKDKHSPISVPEQKDVIIRNGNDFAREDEAKTKFDVCKQLSSEQSDEDEMNIIKQKCKHQSVKLGHLKQPSVEYAYTDENDAIIGKWRLQSMDLSNEDEIKVTLQEYESPQIHHKAALTKNNSVEKDECTNNEGLTSLHMENNVASITQKNVRDGKRKGLRFNSGQPRVINEENAVSLGDGSTSKPLRGCLKKPAEIHAKPALTTKEAPVPLRGCLKKSAHEHANRNMNTTNNEMDANNVITANAVHPPTVRRWQRSCSLKCENSRSMISDPVMENNAPLRSCRKSQSLKTLHTATKYMTDATQAQQTFRSCIKHGALHFNAMNSKSTDTLNTNADEKPRERVIDMSPEDQKKWEMEEMSKPIDLEKAKVNIDPSPFQLVERTSILKVHSLFSMVGINHAYVTKIGRLVGVVGLKELRKAIEDINSNNFVVQNQLKDDVEEQHNSEKPLLHMNVTSDEKVNMTVTSMDSALSHSDNCSDIEMEHIKGPHEVEHEATTTTTTATTEPTENTTVTPK